MKKVRDGSAAESTAIVAMLLILNYEHHMIGVPSFSRAIVAWIWIPVPAINKQAVNAVALSSRRVLGGERVPLQWVTARGLAPCGGSSGRLQRIWRHRSPAFRTVIGDHTSHGTLDGLRLGITFLDLRGSAR
jgi:hypothetical protein